MKIHLAPPTAFKAVLCGLPVAGAVACHSGPTAVPPGGQEVHVAVNGDTVLLRPTTAHAGEVYLVLDNP